MDLYLYKARIATSHDSHPIYDADTLRIDIDLGLKTWRINEPVRLARIDAWEVRGDEREKGLAARDYVRSVLEPGDEIMVRTYKDESGKFGRYLVDLFLDDERCLNDVLVDFGHAEYISY